MTLRVATAPATGLVTLVQAKAQVRVEQDVTDEDAVLDRLILVATAEVEAITQRRYISQELEWVLADWPCAPFRLPVAPVAAAGVTAIAYVDANGDAQTWPTTEYVVTPCGDTVAIRPKLGVTYPLLDPDASEPVKITFTAGVAADSLSAPLAVQACVMIVDELWENRGSGDFSVSQGLRQRLTEMLLPDTW